MKSTPNPRGFPTASPLVNMVLLDRKSETEKEFAKKRTWNFDEDKRLESERRNRQANPSWYRKEKRNESCEASSQTMSDMSDMIDVDGASKPKPKPKLKSKRQRELESLLDGI